MKRISHYITHNIPTPANIRQKATSSPSEAPSKQPTDQHQKKIGDRQRLAKKLGLQKLALNLNLAIPHNQKKIDTTIGKRSCGVKPAKPISKVALERKGLRIESKYAAKPVVKESFILRELIRTEASVFRNINKYERTQ